MATENGLTLLLNTLTPELSCEGATSQQRRSVLLRFINALYFGELNINGQAPDASYKLGEHLIHGGRILFDVTQLDPSQRKQLLDYLIPEKIVGAGNIIEPEAFETHSEKKIEGTLFETRTSVDGALREATRNEHYGMDIAIGGHKIAQANGEYGHVYLHFDRNNPELIQFEIKPARIGHRNQMTGEHYGPAGNQGIHSGFGELNLRHFQTEIEINPDMKFCPLITLHQHDNQNDYNWSRVTITQDTFNQLIGGKTVDPNKALTEPHPNSENSENAYLRYLAMLNWRQRKFLWQPPSCVNTQIKKSQFNLAFSFFRNMFKQTQTTPSNANETELNEKFDDQHASEKLYQETYQSLSNMLSDSPEFIEFLTTLCAQQHYVIEAMQGIRMRGVDYSEILAELQKSTTKRPSIADLFKRTSEEKTEEPPKSSKTP